MNVQERLRQAIERQRERLRAEVPPERAAAILAILAARERLPRAPDAPDLVTGRRADDSGGNLALRLCLEADARGGPAIPGSPEAVAGWAERFLAACGELVAAEVVLAHAVSGFMGIAEEADGSFAAWIARKRAPATWRERADVDWWAGWLAARHEPELDALRAKRPGPAAAKTERAAFSRRLADVRVATMAYQFGYPPDADIDGCPAGTYRAVLGSLVARALDARDRGDAAPWEEWALIAAIAADLAADPAVVERAVAGFTLDQDNAAWHAAAPGIAAPLVRIGPDRLAWSIGGLTTEPLFFLWRELRRRNAAAYHNAAIGREDVFRQDLYALFPEKRFVTSSGRIVLRRAGGDVRTDVDAVVFDRKTGALGFFELKSQDPFARSVAELGRQRDNVLYANRQISGVLDWLKRHGPDDLLARVDARTAKGFRVQKVLPFVLGRYLVRFDDGPEPDRRAAWGTWPQVLRLLDGRPFGVADANPLATLAARIAKDPPLASPPADAPPRRIAIGEAKLVVYPSFAASRAGDGTTG